MAGEFAAFKGRTLSSPAFPDDAGTAPLELVAALAVGDSKAVVSALLGCRVLVPVVAVLDSPAGDQPTRTANDKEADMAVVTVRSRSGRRALPVFSSVATLAAWSSEARPVPVAGVLAARAAFDEGAEALLIDPAGPVRSVIEGSDLLALAESRAADQPAEDPELRRALERAAVAAGVAASQLTVDGEDNADAHGVASADLVVRLMIGDSLDDAAASDVGRTFSEVLCADPAMRGRLGRGLDVIVERPS
jgi:hypothetical protein